MINNIDEMQFQLLETYKEWWQEVSQLGFDDVKYSNPFYCGIPTNWNDSDIRIMICGEEGYGSWNKDILNPTNITELQTNNLGYLNGQRGRGNIYLNKSSQFWIRVKQIEFLQPKLKISDTKDKVSDIPLIWNDCDKICAADCHNNRRNGKLSSKERKLLHSVKTKLLRKEIEITKPTHVVFLGWYTDSLEANSLNLYKKSQKIDGSYKWPLGIEYIEIDGEKVKLYYLYHPSLRKNRELYNKDIETLIQDIKNDKNKYKKEQCYEK